MNRKEYIQPTILSRSVKPSAMVCGSGSNTYTISGSSGQEPTQSGNDIIGEAKLYEVIDFGIEDLINGDDNNLPIDF